MKLWNCRLIFAIACHFVNEKFFLQKFFFFSFCTMNFDDIDEVKNMQTAARKIGNFKVKVEFWYAIWNKIPQPYWNWSRWRWRKNKVKNCITLQKKIKLTVFHNSVSIYVYILIENFHNGALSILKRRKKCLHFSCRREREKRKRERERNRFAITVVIVWHSEIWKHDLIYWEGKSKWMVKKEEEEVNFF